MLEALEEVKPADRSTCHTEPQRNPYTSLRELACQVLQKDPTNSDALATFNDRLLHRQHGCHVFVPVRGPVNVLREPEILESLGFPHNHPLFPRDPFTNAPLFSSLRLPETPLNIPAMTAVLEQELARLEGIDSSFGPAATVYGVSISAPSVSSTEDTGCNDAAPGE